MEIFARVLRRFIEKRKLEKKWGVNVNSPITTAPMLGASGILVGTKDGKVISLDYSGGINWEYKIREEAGEINKLFLEPETRRNIFSAPVSADIDNDGKNEVIFGANNGCVYCLNENGELKWKHQTNGAVTAQAFAYDVNSDGKPEVLVGSKDENLYVFNDKGLVLWRFKADSAIECPVNVLVGDKIQILFGTNGGILYSVDFSGEINWRFRTRGQIFAQCAVGKLDGVNPNILFGSADKSIYVLNKNGDLQWSYATGGRVLSRITLKDVNSDGKNEIFFGSCDNNIYALSHEGKKLWSYETNFWVLDELKIMDINKDGKFEIVFGSYDGEVYVLDAEGDFTPDYVPGLSSVIHQSGHYSALLTHNVGQFHGKAILKYNAEGMIMGSSVKNNEIYISTNKGEVICLKWGE